MSKNLHPITEADFDAIEAAVMETERGRWFLAQFADRNRNSDTTVLLDAIKKLENSVQDNQAVTAANVGDQVRFDLVEMAAAIAQTKREISALRPEGDDNGGINIATEELDAIVTSTETATQEILEAAETVQELAWTMREDGIAETYCEQIDNLVTSIYTACSFQDITGQRTSKVVSVLRYLEERLEAMRHIWGEDDLASDASEPDSEARPDAHLLNGPQLDHDAHSQDDIDLIMVSSESCDDPAQTIELGDALDDEDPGELVFEEDAIEFEGADAFDIVENDDPDELIFDASDVEETAESPKGRIIMVRKPSVGDAPVSEDPEDDEAPEPISSDMDDREAVQLADISANDITALFT